MDILTTSSLRSRVNFFRYLLRPDKPSRQIGVDIRTLPTKLPLYMSDVVSN